MLSTLWRLLRHANALLAMTAPSLSLRAIAKQSQYGEHFQFRNFEGSAGGWGNFAISSFVSAVLCNLVVPGLNLQTQNIITTDYHRFSQDSSYGSGSAMRMWFESVLISCNLVVPRVVFDFRSSNFDFRVLESCVISWFQVFRPDLCNHRLTHPPSLKLRRAGILTRLFFWFGLSHENGF